MAKRRISPGEVIFTDKPIIIVPGSKSAAVCLGCFKVASGKYTLLKNLVVTNSVNIFHLSDTIERCESCTLPLCKSCQTRISNKEAPEYMHGEEECSILTSALKTMSESNRKRMLGPTTFNGEPFPLNASIGPLRLLLIKDEEKKDCVSKMMDHGLERQKDQKTWLLNHVLVAGFIRGACKFGEVVSNDQVQRAIGILRFVFFNFIIKIVIELDILLGQMVSNWMRMVAMQWELVYIRLILYSIITAFQTLGN